MREVTQDETVHEPNDGIHLVVILIVSGIGGWLQLPEWIIITLLGVYFAINFIWIDKKAGDKKAWIDIAKYIVVLLIIWVLQRWLF